MNCSKALGCLGLVSVRGLDHPLNGDAFLADTVSSISFTCYQNRTMLESVMLFKGCSTVQVSCNRLRGEGVPQMLTFGVVRGIQLKLTRS